MGQNLKKHSKSYNLPNGYIYYRLPPNWWRGGRQSAGIWQIAEAKKVDIVVVRKKVENKLSKLPTVPGVYFYKNSAGEIIYIGKAARLRSRVRQYFQNSRLRDPKTEALIAEITDIEWTEVDSEADALFLEAELVRRYQPSYNILLRDDKSQLYIRIDYKSDYPTVSFTRRPLDDGANYFGPYLQSFALKRALRYLRRAFPYAMARPVNQKRASLEYHLGLDPGLEDGRTNLADYRANLRKLMQYLRGQRVALVRELEKNMKQAADAQDFEKAARLRNQLRALQSLSRQSLFGDQEALDASRDQALVELADLLGLYEPQVTHLDEAQGAGEQRTEDAQSGTSKQQPQPATQRFAKGSGGVSGSAGKQARVLRKLRRVECFDISHMQGTDSVASMVVFVNGVPDKTAYRKFKMRLAGNDDVGHLNETLKRRLREENRQKWGLPDLIIVDGGKGQLRAGIAARDFWQLNQPIIGLAKRQEEIIIHKSASIIAGDSAQIIAKAKQMRAYINETADFISLSLPPESPAIKLLQRIRDESHRFAVSYHSTLKRRRQTSSLLDDIPGIGAATRKKLIRHFGSMRAVAKASEVELQAALGRQKGSLVAGYLTARHQI